MRDLFYGDMLPPTGPARPEEGESVLVGTASPVPLRVETVEHHLTPEGAACIATYLHDRLVGRCAIPSQTVEEFLSMELFRHPVALALNARESDRVVEGNLLALVPASDVRSDPEEETEAAWKDSVPGAGYEEVASEEERQGQLVGVFLGQVVRFAADRRFPQSLVREAADMLAGVVKGRIGDVVDRVIQDLAAG